MKTDKSMQLIQQCRTGFYDFDHKTTYLYLGVTDYIPNTLYLPKYFGPFFFWYLGKLQSITSLYKQRSNFFSICHHVQLSVNSQVDHT